MRTTQNDSTSTTIPYKSSLARTPVLKCPNSPTELNRSLDELDKEAGIPELLTKEYVDIQYTSVDEWRSDLDSYMEPLHE